MRKIAALVIFCLCAWTLLAQYPFYYGKNKVIRRSFNWKVLETAHFQIHNYIDNPELIGRVATEAEKAYSRLSLFLGVTIDAKTPIIFYDKQTDLEQTNLFPGLIPPGSFEGFTEPVGHRVVIYGNRPSDELGRLISHELTHSFENQVLYKNSRGSLYFYQEPPLWIMEGLAEFMTGTWDSFALMTVIDSVLNDRMPVMQENGELSSGAYDTGRTPYDFGHLLMEFFYEKHGKKGIRELLLAQRRSLPAGRRRAFLEQFNYTPKTFNYEFKKYILERFKAYQSKENPEVYSFNIGPDFPYGYSFSHQVSPSGELLAALTVNFRNPKLDIVLISLKDGKVIKDITPGVTNRYDLIEYNFNPADGRTFTWDRKGEKIAFFARKEFTYYLFILDVLSDKILQRIPIVDIQKPSSPVFHPGSGLVYFRGVEGIRSFLYVLDTASGQVKKLSGGKLYIKAIDLSPDGKLLIYSARSGDFDKLFLAPLENPEYARQLTAGPSNDIAPSFSLDGKAVYFTSDERGTFNVYSLGLETQNLRRYTDVRTGTFFPVEIPQQKGQVVISVFHKGSFVLFKKETSQALEERQQPFRDPGDFQVPEAVANPALPMARVEPRLEVDQVEVQKLLNQSGVAQLNFKEKDYKPLQKLVVEALPSVTIGTATNGNFFGSAYLTVSDLMGDFSFVLQAASDYGYRQFHLVYLDQKKRLQYYAHFFSEGMPYYFPYGIDYYSNSSYALTIRSTIGGEFGFFYPLSREYRAEITASIFHQTEKSNLLFGGGQLPFGQFFNGMATSLSAALVAETTRFAYYGPNKGYTFRLEATKYFKLLPDSLDAYALSADMRKYVRVDNNTLLAFRLYTVYSGGPNSLLFWTGGNNTVRNVYYDGLVGEQGFIFNAEFRFPLIHAAATPIGRIGPLRGTFWYDLGAYWFHGGRNVDGSPFRLFVPGQFPKLQDGYSSYGFGLETFLLGIPFHFEWTHSINPAGSPFQGFNFWIGFDF